MIRDGTVVVWTFIFLVLSIYKFYCKDCDKNQTAVRLRSIQYLSIITTFCIFIAFLCRGIELFFTNNIILIIVYYLCAQSGMTFLYILVLFRLYHAFKETEYRLTKLTIIIHSIILINSNLSTFASSGFDYFDMYPYNFIFISLASIIYISGLSHLSYHITHSLFLCIINIDEKNTQKKYLQTIVKQTVLANWINFAGFILAITNVSTLLIDLDRDSLIFVLIRHQILALSNCILILCIYLSFTINGDAYYCICKCCHNKCYQICKSRASKRICIEKPMTLNVMDRSTVTHEDEQDHENKAKPRHLMAPSNNITVSTQSHGGVSTTESGYTGDPIIESEHDVDRFVHIKDGLHIDLNELNDDFTKLDRNESTPL